MLSVQRIPNSLRGGVLSSLPFRRYLTRDFRHQSPDRHDDIRTRATTAVHHPPPQPATTDSLAHQQALFPAEFSEYIRYHESTQRELISKVEEEESDALQATACPTGYESAEKKVDCEMRSSGVREALHHALAIFLPPSNRHKTDLSYTNPLRWETDPKELVEPAPATFRDTGGLRQILTNYLQNIELHPHASDVGETLLSDGDEALAALQKTFSDDSLNFLNRVGYDTTDVANWAWIFTSKSLDHAFSRYLALSRDLRKSGRGRIPKFVPLQLLRAREVSALALKESIRSILIDLQLCLDAEEYSGWNWVTRVCLVVRLLRHARRVAPESFEDITTIVRHLFFDYYTVHPRQLDDRELRRLCHIFNRFLSLVSLAPQKIPFNAYMFQQDAQLVLLRLMFAFKPQLPLTREGYRALIAVQLLHRKTTHERTWGEAKSLSWPPWRRIKSGIEQDLEFPGKDSRVIKLLRRMQDAGYTLGDWDKSAGVLAGWDTDQSPTIQTRGVLMRQRRPWLTSWRPWAVSSDTQEGSEQVSGDAPSLWASRVRATRTIREAWASFRSYEQSLGSSKGQYPPYFAMMDKLLASAVRPDSTLAWKYLAGDIKETFEVSPNSRETIYVDTDVPAADEFYQRMLQAGIKPGGDLLASLLKHSPSLGAGFTYIQDSRWTEVTKDVLRNAQKYPVSIIRDSLNKIPMHTLAAFVSLLCRSGLNDNSSFCSVGKYNPVTGQLHGRDGQSVSALTYATQLLLVAGVKDIRVWNALLQGASVGVERHLGRKGGALGRTTWRRLKRILWLKQLHMGIQPDLGTFRHQARILHLMFKDVDPYISPEVIGTLAKTTFIEAVYGRAWKTFLPSRDKYLVVVPGMEDLKLMVGVLVSIRDSQGLVALAKWINEHAGTFRPLERQPDVQEAVEVAGIDMGQRTPSRLRDLLCAIRLFLDSNIDWPARPLGKGEGETRFRSPLSENLAMLQQAQDQSQALGWPSDEDVAAFFFANTAWVERIRGAADMMACRKVGSGKEVREEL